MTTLDKLEELENIIIDFNKYLKTISTRLKQLEIGVQAIVDDLQTKINKLTVGTNNIISEMKKDLRKGELW